MDLILLFTCGLMWALAVLTTISLLKLLKETDRLNKELEKQREELETVEVCIYRDMKQNYGWKTVLCTDERRDDEVREAR